MATGDIATQSLDLGALVNTFLGKSGSTTGSSTTKSNITPEAMQELISQALQGPQGLSAIANGEHAAGLYGGSTKELLTNNLLAQTAAKLAVAQTGTTTTTSGTTKTNAPVNPLVAGGGLLAASLLNGVLKETTGGGIGDLLGSASKGIGGLINSATGGGANGAVGGQATINNPAGTAMGRDDIGTNTQTPSQLEQIVGAAGGSAPSPVSGFSVSPSGNTTIPISSLFPESGSASGYSDYGTSPFIANDNSGTGSDSSSDDDLGPGD